MPTNWAGTPDGLHLDPLNRFAKGDFEPWPRHEKGPILADRAFFSSVSFDQTFGANKVAESTFTPGPIVEEMATRLM